MDEQPTSPAQSVPTVQQVADHLQSYPLRLPSRLMMWGPMVALLAAVVISLVMQNQVATAVPWVLLFAVFMYLSHRARSLRRLEQQVAAVQELAILRRYDEALSKTWLLLPKVSGAPTMYGRVLAFLAGCLDQLKAYEAAIVAYDHIIDQLPTQHPGSVQLRVQRTIAQLQAQHMLDADNSLRGLRQVAQTLKNTAVGAGLRLAQLIQQVRTYHFEDAIIAADHLVDELRPLGVEAAYGHALLALAFHEKGELHMHDHAQLWWSRATLLMTPAALVDRFAELEPLTSALQAESPHP